MQSKYLQKKLYYKTGIDEREYSAEVFKRKEKIELYEQLRKEGCSQLTGLKAIGISKATYYRWQKAYKRRGLFGLESLHKRPVRIRKPQWNSTLETYVSHIRKSYPLFGKYKIKVILKRDYRIETSASTVGRVIKKLVDAKLLLPVSFYYGHVKVKRKRIFNRHAQRWRYGMRSERPGHMIQVDHMVVALGAGYSIRQFTATCPYSRLAVEQAYSHATSLSARDFLEYMRQEFPFPIESIQVDGGSEFMADFEQACKEYNIQLYVLPPRSPQFNGNVERCNGSSRYECYALYDGELNLTSIRKYLKRFMHHYNNFRPHQALQYKTPQQYYQSLGA